MKVSEDESLLEASLAAGIRTSVVAIFGAMKSTIEQTIDNLLVRHSCCNETQDFDLTRR